MFEYSAPKLSGYFLFVPYRYLEVFFMKKFMIRAIELAKLGAGRVSPNPMVGAVIVKNDKIIGEGYHMKYGSDHAEVNAFNNASEDVTGADMYVTLEPCSHYGHTPPCAKAIIEHRIKRVYVGLRDPNPKVSGNGIKMLRKAGIEVIENYCEPECREVNQIFLKYITTKTPYIAMKYAMTLDGKIASYTGNSKWVTNDISRQNVQLLRNNLKGIMVGVNTVIKDDPRLTCRLENGINPIKIVVDSRLRIPENAKVLNINDNSKCIIATTKYADINKIKGLEDKGVKILICNDINNQVDLNDLMLKLGELSIDSILVEGGGTLNYSVLENNLADCIYAYIAPKLIGGSAALSPVEGKGIGLMSEAIKLNNIKISQFDDDICIKGYIRRY